MPRVLPILFSGAMARAILTGRKTQTRRLFKLPPWLTKRGTDLSRAFPDKAYGVTPCLKVPYGDDGCVERVRNPWGFPEPGGVRLWVRETWMETSEGVFYRATDPGWDAEKENTRVTWRPSIFMPRSYSRITLEVTDVRCERLQDISEEDARAEGVKGDGIIRASSVYFELWDSINGKRAPWTINPWAWVVSFRKI